MLEMLDLDVLEMVSFFFVVVVVPWVFFFFLYLGKVVDEIFHPNK